MNKDTTYKIFTKSSNFHMHIAILLLGISFICFLVGKFFDNHDLKIDGLISTIFFGQILVLFLFCGGERN